MNSCIKKDLKKSSPRKEVSVSYFSETSTLLPPSLFGKLAFHNVAALMGAFPALWLAEKLLEKFFLIL